MKDIIAMEDAFWATLQFENETKTGYKCCDEGWDIALRLKEAGDCWSYDNQGAITKYIKSRKLYRPLTAKEASALGLDQTYYVSRHWKLSEPEYIE